MLGHVSAPTVYWYHGATGTGKTKRAYEVALELADGDGDIWWANGSLKWFDGYDGHSVAILDDFRPDWAKLWFMLRLLDRYPMRVEVKGGFRQWVADHIFITCPKPPEECYLEAGEDIDQLLRRVTIVKEF